MSEKTSANLPQRPATLIGRFEETMPDADIRPIRDNAAVREEAACRLLPAIAKTWGKEIDASLLKEAVLEATRWHSDPEAVAKKIASRLRHEVSRDLVEILGNYSAEMDICHTLMVKTWVRMRNIRPRFGHSDEVIGTIRTGLFDVKTVAGKITGIDEDMAIYRIMSKEGGKAAWYDVPYEHTNGRDEPAKEEAVDPADELVSED